MIVGSRIRRETRAADRSKAQVVASGHRQPDLPEETCRPGRQAQRGNLLRMISRLPPETPPACRRQMILPGSDRSRVLPVSLGAARAAGSSPSSKIKHHAVFSCAGFLTPETRRRPGYNSCCRQPTNDVGRPHRRLPWVCTASIFDGEINLANLGRQGRPGAAGQARQNCSLHNWNSSEVYVQPRHRCDAVAPRVPSLEPGWMALVASGAGLSATMLHRRRS